MRIARKTSLAVATLRPLGHLYQFDHGLIDMKSDAPLLRTAEQKTDDGGIGRCDGARTADKPFVTARRNRVETRWQACERVFGSGWQLS
jgi:hypothetical protein